MGLIAAAIPFWGNIMVLIRKYLCSKGWLADSRVDQYSGGA
jgi:hypothetical protein